MTYGGDRIPESPFPVDVVPPLDLDKVKVKDLGDSKMNFDFVIRSIVRVKFMSSNCFGS